MPTLNLGRVRFNWRGEYNAATAYLEHDVVTADGQSYVCIADVTGTGPLDLNGSTYWEGALLRGADYNQARDDAVQAASDAEGSATSANNSAIAASGNATDASNAQAAAETARDKSQDWAEQTEDVEVEPGAYSAKHWANKAQNFGDPNEFDVTADLTSDTRKLREWMAQALANQQAANDAQDTADSAFARANHTGTQPLSTISDAGTAASEDAVTDENDDTAARLTTNARLDIWVRDKERQQLEAASGGLCTIERTTNGQACHMFVLPKTRWEDLLPGQELGTGVHEAFVENGVEKSEILLGMYQAANLNGELVSQPGLAPQRSIDWDQSNSDAQAAGFNLFGNWEWSALAFWCMANGYQPTGNTDNGRSHSDPYQRGILGLDSVDNTATGSGPNAWNHNNAANGIADLVGNVWEWQWGFKMVDGRIFIAPDNDRSLSEPGWADSGYDLPSDANPWSSLTQAGSTQQVQRALIVPNGVADPDGRLYANLTGERFPLRGGSRIIAGNAGLAALALSNARGGSVASVGLRLSRLV